MASNGAKCSQTEIEIKIKTRDYQTFSLQVHKHVPITELKEQVASVSGVPSGLQRLLCRGILMQDDQILSDYNVHDGHALRLIVTEQGSSSRLPGEEDNLNLPTEPGLSASRNSGSHRSHQAASEPNTLTTLINCLPSLREELIVNDAGISENFGSTPELLAEVLSSVRQLLLDQVVVLLSDLGGAISHQANLTVPLTRLRLQSCALRSGIAFQVLGSTFLELGRALTSLRMGQTPADALVDVGGSVGPQRNIGIRIRTASFEPSGLHAQGQGGHQDGAGRNQTRAVPIIGRGLVQGPNQVRHVVCDNNGARSNMPSSLQPQIDGEGPSRVEQLPSGPNMPSSAQGRNSHSQPQVIIIDDDEEEEASSSSRRRGQPSNSHEGQQSPKRLRRE